MSGSRFQSVGLKQKSGLSGCANHVGGPPRAWPRIHERWREERDFNFEGAYRHELGAFGEMLIRLHLQSAERQARILAGEETYDLDAFMPSNATSLVLAIHHRLREAGVAEEDRKSTRLNSSHGSISYAVFCL